jgi:hypothetical protein
MEIDWEVEIGGGASVIEAAWPGFVDLRRDPSLISKIDEAAAFPPLASLLLALNVADSPLWTAKCDLWEPEPAALALYIDILPQQGRVFSQWQHAEAFCRDYVARLASVTLSNPGDESAITLVVRQAIAGSSEGFAVTAYLSAKANTTADAATALAAVTTAFARALPTAPAASGNPINGSDRD